MARPVILDPLTGGPLKEQLEIIVPHGHEDRPTLPVGKCLVPGCGATFGPGEERAYENHAAKCALANIDKLIELSPAQRNRGTIFDDANKDPELERHFREVGDRMRREKRWTVKSHEVAGF